MTTIHWLGAGLSSAPGIRRLAAGPNPLLLWNRTLARAQALLEGCGPGATALPLEQERLRQRLVPGDILVSMLPADMHPGLAQLALDRGAHFISSSYLSPPMWTLDAAARKAGLCLVNEVGLDPGLDHLMAHSLIARYRASGCHERGQRLRFRSYCGGFPALANDFRYKFSWSPLGVLRALKSPARCIQGGELRDVARPWHAITDYEAPLPGGSERFEAYPNRDSLPFIEQYHFDPGWSVDEFVRGTLRLPGWSAAWRELFNEIETLQGAAGEARLRQLSDELWSRYRYLPGEQDRVVLCVELQSVDASGKSRWHQAYTLDARGDDAASAMARTVSVTVALAVEAVAGGEIRAGVSAAPTDPALIESWFTVLAAGGDNIVHRDLQS
jgi:saccharopine dehydrogenase-like NADP-dependent oxidoreductase